MPGKGRIEMSTNSCRLVVILLITFLPNPPVLALEPDEILIVANSNIAESVALAEYYSAKRKIPTDNILALPLGAALADTISRDDYQGRLAEPIRKELARRRYVRPIRCLLTTYGVPFKVGRRGPLKGRQERLSRLREQQALLKERRQALEQQAVQKSSQDIKSIEVALVLLQSQIDLIVGKETSASVDSELSMVLFGGYELYRWQPNSLKDSTLYWDFRTLMVCRLDGPSIEIARKLVDKSISAEKKGLKGIAYVDSGYSLKARKPLYREFDRSLGDLALMLKTQTQIPVVQQRTAGLFLAGQCPSTALYCGWYSLRNYVDAFDFVDGAIGYHISSLEAVSLRDPNSSQWCPAMLRDGITATLGAVAEPYLRSIPKPDEFFTELLNGRCLVEAYYRTKPFNSWQLVLIGDPLYRPFRRHQAHRQETGG